LRILGLALAGVLALSAPMAAHAVLPGSKAAPAGMGRAPGIVQVWDGSASGRHPPPGRSPQWKGGWVPPHWGPNGYHRGAGDYRVWGGPTYWVWGSGGGAWDYPFADWQGPDGGWGNP
jgi:hypothetical protein